MKNTEKSFYHRIDEILQNIDEYLQVYTPSELLYLLCSKEFYGYSTDYIQYLS